MIDLCVLQDAYHKSFCVFKAFYASGMPGAEKTKLLVTVVFNSLIYILSQSFFARTMPVSVAALSFAKRRLLQDSKLTNTVHIFSA